MVKSLTALKSSNHRITKSRQHIFEVLKTVPVRASDIQNELRKKHFPSDLVTIYRTLELFVRLGIVTKTTFSDSIARFELASEEKHHHHLICDSCGSVEDAPIDESFLNELKDTTRFTIKRHTLEIYGSCTRCQASL